MSRYTATVKSVEKAGSPFFVWRYGEYKEDWPKYDRIVVFEDVRDFNTGELFTDELIVPERKRLSQVGIRIFPDNKVAFDATEKDGVLSNLRNICGEEVLDCL